MIKKIQKIKDNKILKIIYNIIYAIIFIFILLILIIAVLQRTSNNEISLGGYRIFVVATGSMIPKYQVGDVILVKETDTNKIQVGEDVTYRGETGSVNGILVTHRVKDIEEIDGQRVFHTQGIANNLEDPVVYAHQINGVVQSKMYILSFICRLLNNKYVFYFGAILPLSIYIGFRIFRERQDRYERESR